MTFLLKITPQKIPTLELDTGLTRLACHGCSESVMDMTLSVCAALNAASF